MSDVKNKHVMNVDQNQGCESADQKILDSINWYINCKNEEKNSIINDHNDLARRFETMHSDNQSLNDMMVVKNQKISTLIEENARLKTEAKEFADRKEEMRQQLMAETKKLCIRCASKSKWQYHSLPFCSNECYNDMAQIFQK